MEMREKRAYEALDTLGIDYDVYQHEPVMTIEAAKELDEKTGVPICKNLFLSTRHGTEFYLLFMEGKKKFNTGKVSKQLGVPRLTFASDDKLLEFLNIYPGSVTPLGLLNDKENKVKFLIDQDVLHYDKVAIHPCVNTATVILQKKDLIEKLLPACGHAIKAVEV